MGLGSTHGLTDAEMAAVREYSGEFLDAARYGELEDLQIIYGHDRLRELIDFRGLVDPDSHTTPLMFAAANGHLDCMQFLAEIVGVEINNKNGSGNTALHWAALNGHVECVHYLIARGADVMAANQFGRTAFDEAIARDKKDCCEILVREEVRLAGVEDNGEGEEIMMDDNARVVLDGIDE